MDLGVAHKRENAAAAPPTSWPSPPAKGFPPVRSLGPKHTTQPLGSTNQRTSESRADGVRRAARGEAALFRSGAWNRRRRLPHQAPGHRLLVARATQDASPCAGDRRLLPGTRRPRRWGCRPRSNAPHTNHGAERSPAATFLGGRAARPATPQAAVRRGKGRGRWWAALGLRPRVATEGRRGEGEGRLGHFQENDMWSIY
jgi:hypothetical protein